MTKEQKVLDYFLGESDDHKHKENWDYIPNLVTSYFESRGFDVHTRKEIGKDRQEWDVAFASTTLGKYRTVSVSFKSSSTTGGKIRAFTKLFLEYIAYIGEIQNDRL